MSALARDFPVARRGVLDVAVKPVLPLDLAGGDHDGLEKDVDRPLGHPVDASHREVVLLDGRSDVDLDHLAGKRAARPVDIEGLAEAAVCADARSLFGLDDERDLDLHGGERSEVGGRR